MKKMSWLFMLFSGFTFGQDSSTPVFKFAISGDSRNCGDVVMPAIAAGARKNGANFYWHLGDMRAIYTFDEDLVPPAKLALPPRPVPLNVSTYLASAWPDFIARQMAPFGWDIRLASLPLFLSVLFEKLSAKERQELIKAAALTKGTPLCPPPGKVKGTPGTTSGL